MTERAINRGQVISTVWSEPNRSRQIKGLRWQTDLPSAIERQRVFRLAANLAAAHDCASKRTAQRNYEPEDMNNEEIERSLNGREYAPRL